MQPQQPAAEQLVIPEPHAQAINDRMMITKAIEAQLQTLIAEDRRHIDALLRTANLNPMRYAQYQLQRTEDGQWVLHLALKQQEAAPQQEVLPPLAKVNGSIHPSAQHD